MASEAIVLMNIIPLACIIITLGCVLIYLSLDGAMTIVYDDQEAAAADDQDDNAEA